MPEPTGGLGGPLVPRPTGILSSYTCPGNSNIPHIISHVDKVIKKIMIHVKKSYVTERQLFGGYFEQSQEFAFMLPIKLVWNVYVIRV